MKDDWYYIHNDQQFGPVPLKELKTKIADYSINPPVTLAWHEGMENWKPVYEISQICDVSPLALTQSFKLPSSARIPEDNKSTGFIKDGAADRALARAKEFDKINATGKDDWYYIQSDQQFGPVTLDELKVKITDLSINPPVILAWHEGMDGWKHPREISQICGVSPLAATQYFKLPEPARRPGDGVQ